MTLRVDLKAKLGPRPPRDDNRQAMNLIQGATTTLRLTVIDEAGALLRDRDATFLVTIKPNPALLGATAIARVTLVAVPGEVGVYEGTLPGSATRTCSYERAFFDVWQNASGVAVREPVVLLSPVYFNLSAAPT